MGCSKMVLVEMYNYKYLHYKQDLSQINNLSSQLTEQEKEQTKPKARIWKKIIKIRAAINEKENIKTVEDTKETKSWLFEKNQD